MPFWFEDITRITNVACRGDEEHLLDCEYDHTEHCHNTAYSVCYVTEEVYEEHDGKEQHI